MISVVDDDRKKWHPKDLFEVRSEIEQKQIVFN